MIAIIDYGMGNSKSIKNMLYKLGYNSLITKKHNEIEEAEKIILPGVGAFDAAMKNLKNFDLINLLNDQVLEKEKQILGICLGMQLLAEYSEEGILPGLSWIPGKVKKFKNIVDRKIPHMGWNTIKIINENSLIKKDAETKFYFVHSYYYDTEERYVMTKTNYSEDFTSSVFNKNIYGVQFHPEKSHKHGMKVLKNFGMM